MDEKTLTRLLRAEGAEAGQPGWRCPDEALLSAYVEHGIPDDKRRQLESHLADCEACLGQVAFLARQPAELAESATAVPRGAVARARDLVARTPSFWRPLVLRWAPAVAGIAYAVFVLVAVFKPVAEPQAPAALPGHRAASAGSAQPTAEQVVAPSVAAPQVAGRTPRAEQSATAPRPTVRTSVPAATGPMVVAPAEDATLARHDLEFRWQAVPGSLHYEIDVVTADGTSVWHSRVEGTSARPPDIAKLDAGAKYFVWVKAFLSGGETVKSAAVSFRIAGQ
jgi:hypothetical protein